VVRPIQEREGDGDRFVRELRVGVQHLVLRDRGAAPRTPGHRAMPHVQPATLVAPLEEAPVVLDVVIGHREVGVRPVHPLAQPPGLLRLDVREVDHPFAAGTSEALEAQRLDLPLRVESQGLLDFDFHPQALAIETILESLRVAAQRSVALDDVLEGASPRMMDAHRIVCGDRTIEEGEAWSATILGNETRKDLLSFPELQRGVGNSHEVKRPRRGKHARLPLSGVDRSGFWRCLPRLHAVAEKRNGRQEP
jgi:hypothetical protein